MLCHYQDARRFLMRALQAEPKNPEIGSELASIDTLLKKQRDEERLICQRMFTVSKSLFTKHVAFLRENHKMSSFLYK